MNINEMELKTIQAQNLIDGRQRIPFQIQKLTRQHGQNQTYCKKRRSGQEAVHFCEKATQKPGRQSFSTATST